VVGVNDHFFPQHTPPREEEVCQLLVALTRARKSCTLVSADRFGGQVLRPSLFIDWLQPVLDTVRVNKNYFS
jgi:superfamily I DNA/RNA helicase